MVFALFGSFFRDFWDCLAGQGVAEVATAEAGGWSSGGGLSGRFGGGGDSGGGGDFGGGGAGGSW